MPGGCFFAFIATLYIIFEPPLSPPQWGDEGFIGLISLMGLIGLIGLMGEP